MHKLFLYPSFFHIQISKIVKNNSKRYKNYTRSYDVGFNHGKPPENKSNGKGEPKKTKMQTVVFFFFFFFVMPKIFVHFQIVKNIQENIDNTKLQNIVIENLGSRKKKEMAREDQKDRYKLL
jgi:hypothetical protein